MSAPTEKTQLVDWEQVETRQTPHGYELLCPVCGQWRRELLATAAGVLCSGCWKRKKDEGAPGAG